MMYICISKLGHLGSENGLVPNRHQVIFYTSQYVVYELDHGEQISVKFQPKFQENVFENVIC